MQAAQQAGGLAAAAAGMPSAYVQAVQGCVAAGDGTSLALHALASGLVGPFWEEVRRCAALRSCPAPSVQCFDGCISPRPRILHGRHLRCRLRRA